MKMSKNGLNNLKRNKMKTHEKTIFLILGIVSITTLILSIISLMILEINPNYLKSILQ